MNEISIIGYGTLGRKIFEVISAKYKIKVYNRTLSKLKNININNNLNNR